MYMGRGILEILLCQEIRPLFAKLGAVKPVN